MLEIPSASGDKPGAGSPIISMRTRLFIRLLLYAWAAPTTLVGLTAGLLTLCTGGTVQRRRGTLEFHGGLSRWFADRIGFGAMTLGHVIIGRDRYVSFRAEGWL